MLCQKSREKTSVELRRVEDREGLENTENVLAGIVVLEVEEHSMNQRPIEVVEPSRSLNALL